MDSDRQKKIIMDDFKTIIDRVEKYDLENAPFDKIKNDLTYLEKFGLIILTLPKGKSILRARLNDDESPFNTREALQYVPSDRNKWYGRASSPNKTMFYGSVIPDDVKEDDYDNSRVTATIETSKLVGSSRWLGQEQITYGRWEVLQDINLFAVCYHKDFIVKSPNTAELYKAYRDQLMRESEELVNRSLTITDMLGRQFAKEVNGERDFEYKISAAFTEVAVEKGLAGVYYPSVKSLGLGFNVALSPEIVDAQLRLKAIGECTIYKYGDKFLVDNDTVCELQSELDTFQLEPVQPKDHMGRTRALKHLRKSWHTDRRL